MIQRTAVVASSSGLHARPAAIFVKAAGQCGVKVRVVVDGKKPANAASMLAVLALGAGQGTSVTLESDADGPEAAEAVEHLATTCSRRTSTRRSPRPAADDANCPAARSRRRERSRGRPDGQDGPATRAAVGAIRSIDGDAEAELAAAALDTVSADLAGRSLEATDPTASAVLDAFSMIAADPELRDQVTELIAQRLDAPHALYGAFEGYREMLLGAGGYLAERAADLADIRDRVIAVVLGLPMPGIPDPGHPFVLVADDLSPADTARSIRRRSWRSSPSGAAPRATPRSWPARSGLPCVVGCTGIMDVADGTLVGVDAGAGTVAVGIPESEVAAIAERADGVGARASRASADRAAPPTAIRSRCSTTSARRTTSVSLDDSFEGVGLFRTEFLFLDRHDRPFVRRAAPGVRRRAEGGRRAARSRCARSTPAPTSRSRSSTCSPSRTRRSGSAGCGSACAASTCSTSSWRRSLRPPPTCPGPTCG